MGRALGTPTAYAVRICFVQGWTCWAGMPQNVFVDQGHEFRGDFAAWLTQHGTEIEQGALEAPWQTGIVERHGGLWKECWRRVCQDTQVNGIVEMQATAAIVTQAKNDMIRHSGYSPSQWVLGNNMPRVPGSLSLIHI